jgi:hypothetical protein
MAVLEVVTIVAMGFGAVAGILGAMNKEQQKGLEEVESPAEMRVVEPPEPEDELTPAERKAVDRWFRDLI